MTAPLFSLEFIQNSLGVKPAAGNPLGFSEISTDSRRLKKNALFVALKGDRFDGHDYLTSAVENGAAGVICDRAPTGPLSTEVAVFVVPDTLKAFQKLAAHWREQFTGPVIAIGGNVGKTTTKDLTACALQGVFPDLTKTRDSQNGFAGIPMTLLEIRPETQAAVVEIGIDEIGAMEQHLNIVRPNVAVLTSVGPEHLEKLGDTDTAIDEELALLETVYSERAKDQRGMIAINLDDPTLLTMNDRVKDREKVITFSLESNPSANLFGTRKVEQSVLSVKFNGAEDQEESFEVPNPLPGEHNARNLLAALSIGRLLGVSLEQMSQSLLQHQESIQGWGRSEVHELNDGVQFICDYYNANPTSMIAAFNLLYHLKRKNRGQRRTFVALGDMLELGGNEEIYHRDLAQMIVQQGIQGVFLHGERMAWLYDELQQMGFSGFFEVYSNHRDLALSLESQLQPGDIVLIKGSRGMKMEEVWKILRIRGNN